MSGPWDEIAMLPLERTRWRYAARWGDGRRPPLLLINGFSCSLEVLEPFVEALPTTAGVLCLEVPGTGRSPLPPAPYRLSGLAGLLRRGLAALGHTTVDVLGVSWGGTLAQQFAVSEPAGCRRLILASTGALPIVRPSPAMVGALFSVRRFSWEGAMAIGPQLYGGKVQRRPELARVLTRRVGGSRLGDLYQQLALAGWTSLPWLHRVRQPALVLSGRADRLVPPVQGRLLARCLPHARLYEFDDGHLGLLTSADELAAEVEAFLAAEAPEGEGNPT